MDVIEWLESDAGTLWSQRHHYPVGRGLNSGLAYSSGVFGAIKEDNYDFWGSSARVRLNMGLEKIPPERI
jgi:hypothetical protein